jgi:hypothetical protein
MGKAKGNHTPKQRSLYDNARWMPLEKDLRIRIEETGDMRLAVTGLEEETESGERPYMRINLKTGKRETGFMKECCIHCSDEGHVTVYRGKKNDPKRWDFFFPHPKDEPPDYAYFVSRPPSEGLGSTSQLQADDEYVTPMRVVPPGPKPKDDWPRWVARWLILKATEDPSDLQNVDALVEEVRDWLEDEKIFAPKDNKRIRKEIANLLVLIRR